MYTYMYIYIYNIFIILFICGLSQIRAPNPSPESNTNIMLNYVELELGCLAWHVFWHIISTQNHHDYSNIYFHFIVGLFQIRALNPGPESNIKIVLNLSSKLADIGIYWHIFCINMNKSMQYY